MTGALVDDLDVSHLRPAGPDGTRPNGFVRYFAMVDPDRSLKRFVRCLGNSAGRLQTARREFG
jgi:hypothetical protein